jgi:LPXTG-motif cell wall-anchored protein
MTCSERSTASDSRYGSGMELMELAATGVGQNPLIWIIGGIVLVIGVGAVILARVLKPKAPADPLDPAQPAE